MIQVDNISRVYVGEEFAFIEIGDYPDVPKSHIEMRTTDKASQDWFGKFNVMMTPEYAIALGETLIKTGNDKLKGKL